MRSSSSAKPNKTPRQMPSQTGNQPYASPRQQLPWPLPELLLAPSSAAWGARLLKTTSNALPRQAHPASEQPRPKEKPARPCFQARTQILLGEPGRVWPRPASYPFERYSFRPVPAFSAHDSNYYHADPLSLMPPTNNLHPTANTLTIRVLRAQDGTADIGS